ncbi:MAG: ATP-grasp domain-containing protein [Catenulispora sp.]|nr:ATP-grasp domain-containing protein [Catenulispora sp.]
MSTPIDVLALSPQRTSTSELLADAARARGAAVRVIDPAGLRPGTDEQAAYYGGPIFGARIASALDIALLAPADDFLQTLPPELAGRRIEAMSAAEARRLPRPFFAKPPTDKSFDAGVFSDGSRLPVLPPDTLVQVSEVVTFAEEHRLFLLDGAVHAASRYARFGHLDAAPASADALAFGKEAAARTTGLLPSAVVLDVGLISDPDTGVEQWAVVEANMAWFAHSYTADPDRVLDVVIAAAGPRSAVRDADLRFVAEH